MNHPEHWEIASLDDVAKVILGQSPPGSSYNESGDGMPFFQGKAEFGAVYPTVRKWTTDPKRIAEKDDILMSVRAPVGPTNLSPGDCSIGRGLAAIRAGSQLDPVFLHWWLRFSKDKLAEDATGTTFQAINGKQLRSFQVPLPPIDEQRRIVAAIEEKVVRLDIAADSLDNAGRRLLQFREAIRQAAMEGRLIEQVPGQESASVLTRLILDDRRTVWESEQLRRFEEKGKHPSSDAWKAKFKLPVPATDTAPDLPDGWDWVSIDQIAAAEPRAITDGPFGSNLKTAHYTESGPRVIRLQNIGDDAFIDEEAHISEDHFTALTAHSVREDDIVVASLGQELPRACVIPKWVPPAIVKADCVRIRPHEGVDSRYLSIALNSPPTRQMAKGHVHGVGRPRLNLSQLRGVGIPLPPSGEQRRIASEADRLFTITQFMEQAIQAAYERSDALRSAVLAAAFKGDLLKYGGSSDVESEEDRIRRLELHR